MQDNIDCCKFMQFNNYSEFYTKLNSIYMYQYCQLMMIHFIFVAELMAGCIAIQLLQLNYHHVLPVLHSQ